ncbi:uncharacterized protein B0H18DRAFT_951655 [Fomitopsis serialis]|uniref:uncharacterized protein n=1 Tax=Fomitopsis serialis TaxID=139415 RepID=UPI00200733A2|nr:uncharacterized protein B0H18DRAFT_951655 [Neoantrodia serialis]KAH9934308.1 hypothetical protein B0H18DRAFT_951655 [Neoantrodia serialis]
MENRGHGHHLTHARSTAAVFEAVRPSPLRPNNHNSGRHLAIQRASAPCPRRELWNEIHRTSVNLVPLAPLADRSTASTQRPEVAPELDVTEPEETIKRKAAEVVAVRGRLDVLVNNAGERAEEPARRERIHDDGPGSVQRVLRLAQGRHARDSALYARTQIWDWDRAVQFIVDVVPGEGRAVGRTLLFRLLLRNATDVNARAHSERLAQDMDAWQDAGKNLDFDEDQGQEARALARKGGP